MTQLDHVHEVPAAIVVLYPTLYLYIQAHFLCNQFIPYTYTSSWQTLNIFSEYSFLMFSAIRHFHLKVYGAMRITALVSTDWLQQQSLQM